MRWMRKFIWLRTTWARPASANPKLHARVDSHAIIQMISGRRRPTAARVDRQATRRDAGLAIAGLERIPNLTPRGPERRLVRRRRDSAVEISVEARAGRSGRGRAPGSQARERSTVDHLEGSPL